jgi:hypothetical protein
VLVCSFLDSRLNLGDNNIQSEGFNLLLRALRESSIEDLNCNSNRCGINLIEIDGERIPRNSTKRPVLLL